MPRVSFTYEDGTPATREAQIHLGYLVQPKRLNLPYLDMKKAEQSADGSAVIEAYNACHHQLLDLEKWRREQKQHKKQLWQDYENGDLSPNAFMKEEARIDEAIEARSEDIRNNITATLWDNPQFTQFFIPIKSCEIVIPYKDAERFPDHAAFAAAHNVSQQEFKQVADALEQQQHHPETNVSALTLGIIDGAEYGHPDSYITLLPKDDPRLMLIGKMINSRVPQSTYCCDSIDRTASHQTIGQIASDTINTVVMMKKTLGHIDPESDPIVGKTTVWQGQYHNPHSTPLGLCFNGWHGAYESDTPTIMSVVAQRLLQHNPQIQKVTYALPQAEAFQDFPDIADPDQKLTPLETDVDFISMDYLHQGLVLSRHTLRAKSTSEEIER